MKILKKPLPKQSTSFWKLGRKNKQINRKVIMLICHLRHLFTGGHVRQKAGLVIGHSDERVIVQTFGRNIQLEVIRQLICQANSQVFETTLK